MRIGVIGKGGSGKTSTSWMLLQAAQAAGHDVWGLDADYNQHLASMFQLPLDSIAPLADRQDSLIEYVLGSRTDRTPQTFDKSTLPAEGSRLIALAQDDPWLADHTAASAQGVPLLRVGNSDPADFGMKCYHVCTAAADILLSHLAQRDDQWLVVDFTAGVDPLASPLYLKVDVLVLVIEPTLKGVAVARQWAAAIADQPVRLCLVANKVAGPEDADWLHAQLSPLMLEAVILQEPAIAAIERGQAVTFGSLLIENWQTLTKLIGALGAMKGDQAAGKRQELERLQALRQKAKTPQAA